MPEVLATLDKLNFIEQQEKLLQDHDQVFTMSTYVDKAVVEN